MRPTRIELTLLLCVGMSASVSADMIDLTPGNLWSNATDVVVGEIVDLEVFDARVPMEDFAPVHRRGHVDRIFRYTIRIANVEKSSIDLTIGQMIQVDAWQLLYRPGGQFATITYQGHRPLPAKGQTVRAFLHGGIVRFQPVDPNGFAPAVAGTMLGPPVSPASSQDDLSPWDPTKGSGNSIPFAAGLGLGVLGACLVMRLISNRERRIALAVH